MRLGSECSLCTICLVLTTFGSHHINILIYEKDMFDYRAGEPPEDKLTVLRALEVRLRCFFILILINDAHRYLIPMFFAFSSINPGLRVKFSPLRVEKLKLLSEVCIVAAARGVSIGLLSEFTRAFLPSFHLGSCRSRYLI